MKRFALFFLLLCSIQVWAGDDELRAQRALESKHYTVKVNAAAGDVFTSEIQRGHGSGFIVALSETEGIVFTNAHVVAVPRRSAVHIEIEFFSPDGAAERTPAEVLFLSPVHDFAALRFDPRKLQRLGTFIQVAPLASPEEMQRLVIPGVSIMAAGNPLNSRDICTFGNVSGFHIFEWQGLHIQGDASINPGNSGGPLIHVGSGKVIGINTAKIVGAESMGFSLPITTAAKDFDLWQKHDHFAENKSMITVFGEYPMEWVEGLGMSPAIEAENLEPNFLDRYPSVYVVEKTHPESGFRHGDILLSLNGVAIGDRGYRMREIVQESEGSVQAKVIRRGKVEVIAVKVFSSSHGTKGEKSRFVTFSGFVVTETSDFQAFIRGDRKSKAIISQILPGSMAADSYSSLVGSSIVGIQVGSRRLRVKTLDDVIRILNQIPKEGPQGASLVVYLPMNAEKIVDKATGLPVLQPHARDIVVPVIGLVSHQTHDLDLLRANFDFSGFANPQSRSGIGGLEARAASCRLSVVNSATN